MSHITFVIAKQLLEDKKTEVADRLRHLETKKANNLILEIKRELKAIDDEIWLLNNW